MSRLGAGSRAPQWFSGPMANARLRRDPETMSQETTPTPLRIAAPILLTEAGLRARMNELDTLREAKRSDIRRRLRDARGYGEPGGNDEYLATREDEAILDARIAALEATLAQASVLDERTAPGAVGVGSIVTVDDVNCGAVARYRLVGSHEARAADDVSVGSPVGQALLGQQVGDTVVVDLPNGGTRQLRIASVGPSNS
jgi:transcription elongation factor GreA